MVITPKCGNKPDDTICSAYKMDKKPLGLVVIINNVPHDNTILSKGADKDKENMKSCLNTLGIM